MNLDIELDKSYNLIVKKISQKTRQQKIKLYVEGLKAKLRQTIYAFEQIEKYATAQESGENTEDDITPQEKLNFYVDSFWTYLYSVFDILAQVINQTNNLGIKEDKVSFAKVVEQLTGQKPHLKISKELTKIKKSRTYNYIKSSRNCSTHRRQIYILSEIQIITETPGYGSTGGIQTQVSYFSEDPLAMKPKVNKKKEVCKYCEKTKTEVVDDIKKIFTLLK